MVQKQSVEGKLYNIGKKAGVALEHVREVYHLIQQDGSFTEDVIIREIDWFYNDLGVDNYYFTTTSRPLIARHIQSLYAAKILAQTSGEDVGLNLKSESDYLAMYACRDEHQYAVAIEQRIEEKFPEYRLQSYRTSGTTSPDSKSHLRLYFLTPPIYADHEPGSNDILKIGSLNFLDSTKEDTINRYQGLLNESINQMGPVITTSHKPESNEIRIMIAYQRGTTHSYFSAISDVLTYYKITSKRKYIEQFANGVVVYSFYLDDDLGAEKVNDLKEDLSLLYVLPRTSLTRLFQSGDLSMQEVVYAYAAWKFTHQFLTRYSDEYVSLASALHNDPMRMGLLTNMKSRLSKDTFTEGRISEAIFANPGLIKELYTDFSAYQQKRSSEGVLKYDNNHNQDLELKIIKEVSSEVDQKILKAFLNFNRHVLKTNFYRDTKIALAFRLDPAFLPKLDYPDTPFGIFYLVGSEFRGFHIRFRDIARGGIRIIRSANPQSYARNIDYLFDENYNLAHTQQKKNKDIPEGGSKGTILLSLEHQDKAESAFRKYIDSLLDLMMPNEEVVDHYGKEELLFLGPDEGTAEVMDWASLHAKHRGYPFSRAFTTGKSVSLGGVPHDLYGMTTNSVHQYVLGILDKLGVNESDISKMQTGGPDGDLGSNEIKISSDNTLSIVDGSGVLYDPNGINRDELNKLADARQMVRHFDKSKLGDGGFLVTIEETDIVLPDGSKIESGLQFRNEFHLNALSSAELFVPCGGRPNAVHINNVDALFDKDDKPRFKYIVEGANLFITQEARIHLEKAGVIVYKDASANKGGVTSSSLEVLAALALNDEAQFSEHMEVKETTPEFYAEYVEQIKTFIKENADLEFESIWQEHEQTGVYRSILTDKLSDKINQLNDRIKASSLWENQELREMVLAKACPKNLLDMIGLETFMERVPETYQQAIFGAHLASRYVYKCGLQATEIEFFEFVNAYLNGN